MSETCSPWVWRLHVMACCNSNKPNQHTFLCTMVVLFAFRWRRWRHCGDLPELANSSNTCYLTLQPDVFLQLEVLNVSLNVAGHVLMVRIVWCFIRERKVRKAVVVFGDISVLLSYAWISRWTKKHAHMHTHAHTYTRAHTHTTGRQTVILVLSTVLPVVTHDYYTRHMSRDKVTVLWQHRINLGWIRKNGPCDATSMVCSEKKLIHWASLPVE